MSDFLSDSLDDKTCWRAIVLFGRNVASYKFALARSLFEVARSASDLIRLDELAVPFSRHLCRHLETAPVQIKARSSRFIEECARFNRGEISHDRLLDSTVQLGFNNVIDAFHVVNRDDVPIRFFHDERAGAGGIRLTEAGVELLRDADGTTLAEEVEARWRLVETAWELGVGIPLIQVDEVAGSSRLYVNRGHRRVGLTSARNALNGYQKGCCFFCFAPVSLVMDGLMPDVDHFFPHVLGQYLGQRWFDGVWNLTLACRDCNRGTDGKFARVPSRKLLARLHRRNEFLIASHHPLRETLIRQTGVDSLARRGFLNDRFRDAKEVLIHEWEPILRGPRRF